MEGETQQILQELKEIKVDIKLIMENMPDKDMFLTADEEKLLQASYENEKKGVLVPAESLRNEIKK